MAPRGSPLGGRSPPVAPTLRRVRGVASIDRLPDGLRLVRSTPTFDESTVPAGLLAAHRVADGVWGLLVVESGSLSFEFDDDPDGGRVLGAGDRQVIPPARSHHLVVDSPVRFHVEFHRRDES